MIIGAIWPGHHRIVYIFTGPEYFHLEDEIFAWVDTTAVVRLKIGVDWKFIFGVMSKIIRV